MFSKPLMKLITQHAVSDIGELAVEQATKDFYSYIDFTPMAEYLYECVDKTVEVDLSEELEFLARYDVVKKKV